MNIELLDEVADKIDPFKMMGSKWGNCEAETIAAQCIASCRHNYKEHGDAFSWASSNLGCITGAGLGDNPRGMRMVVADGSIVVEEYTGGTKSPEGTQTRNGNPLVLRVTDGLLNYVLSHLKG